MNLFVSENMLYPNLRDTISMCLYVWMWVCFALRLRERERGRERESGRESKRESETHILIAKDINKRRLLNFFSLQQVPNFLKQEAKFSTRKKSFFKWQKKKKNSSLEKLPKFSKKHQKVVFFEDTNFETKNTRISQIKVGTTGSANGVGTETNFRNKQFLAIDAASWGFIVTIGN